MLDQVLPLNLHQRLELNAEQEAGIGCWHPLDRVQIAALGRQGSLRWPQVAERFGRVS